MIYKMSQNGNALLKYGKAKGKYILHNLLPNISDIKELYVIDSYEDYIGVADELPDSVIVRADAEIGKKPTLGVRGCAISKTEIPEYITKVKQANRDGAVVIIDSKIDNLKTPIKASFNVEIEWGNYIYIDYLGEGFDIGGITKGEDAHEVYKIPWDEILWLKDYKRYLVKRISDEEYEESLKRKIKALIQKKGMDEEKAKSTIPPLYKPIDDDIHKQIYNKIILAILQKREEIARIGTGLFGVQGMIRQNEKGDNIIQPVEFRISSRHYENGFENGYSVNRQNQYRKSIMGNQNKQV